MTSPRIVFMGTPEFAVPSLKALGRVGFLPIAVVTGADKPKGRGLSVLPTPVKSAAIEMGIQQILQPVSVKSPEFTEQIRLLEPDIIVVVAFRILPESVFSLAKLGTFNLHSSLLPKYRGAAPIQWAIINGESETGVTTFYLQSAVDTGNIIAQKKIPLSASMTGSELHDVLSEIGSDLVVETVKSIVNGTVKTQPQENGLATPAPKLFKEDFHIHWELPGLDLKNRIRAFDAYPGAYSTLLGKIVKLFTVDFHLSADYSEKRNGEIVHVSPQALLIRVSDGILTCKELQLEGKKRLPISDLVNGGMIKLGQQFI